MPLGIWIGPLPGLSMPILMFSMTKGMVMIMANINPTTTKVIISPFFFMFIDSKYPMMQMLATTTSQVHF